MSSFWEDTAFLPHNNLEYLDKVLAGYKNKYITRLVIVDGVYSQDGDIGPIPALLEICH